MSPPAPKVPAPPSPVSSPAPRLSIPTRIFLGFALALGAFVAVLILSVAQHQRTSESLELMERGYIPLAITVGEAQANQALFATLLDRVLEEQDSSATRHWLDTVRRVRPATMKRALHDVHSASVLHPAQEDVVALERIRAELRTVEDIYSANEDQYDAFFRAIDRGEGGEASKIVGLLKREEREIQERLRNARDTVQERLATFSTVVASREQRSTVLLIALTVL
ncbi:MAG: hypothetical protein KC416_17455, partial [Myxococcales bacterium]|nr:hypothetical protein [Myxococcales bacterium]